jgi:hypothetical protein
MSAIRAFIPVLIAFTVLSVQASSLDKEGLLSKYRGKFVVVINEGISTCFLAAPGDPGDLAIMIRGLDVGDVHARALSCSAEPAHKGEVLEVSHIAFHSGYLQLSVRNVSPHAITRGIGAFAHQSLEQGRATVTIRAGNDGKDMDAADALAAHWFKPFDTAADAARFGNTATGVFVNQVKAGMSFAEVENALGVPQTRVDLGEKVLYKYKDMTVEFHDGKVTDVR